MARTKELSKETRDKIVELRMAGKSYSEIGKLLGKATSTIGAIVRKWKKLKTTDNLPRKGAPRKISPHQLSMILTKVMDHPTTTRKELVNELLKVGTIVSKATIGNTLNRHGFKYVCPKVDSLLNPEQFMAQDMTLDDPEEAEEMSVCSDDKKQEDADTLDSPEEKLE